MNIMFDECFGRRAAKILIEWFAIYKPPPGKPPILGHFLIDYLGRTGVRDEDWVPLLALPDPPWLVITTDQGRRSGGAPLHLLLPEFKITSVYLSGKIHTTGGFDKVHAVASVLPDILTDAENAPRGTRYKIKRRTVQGQHKFRYELWPLPTDKPTQTP